MFNERLQEARKKAGLTQEQLAGMLGVARQSIQKWECGTSMPDIGHLKDISRCLGFSIDTLLSEEQWQTNNEFIVRRVITPTYVNMDHWDAYCKSLKLEYYQCIDEGKEIERYQKLFDAVESMPDFQEKDDIADVLYSIVLAAPKRCGYIYYEPSDIEQIRINRDGFLCPMIMPDADTVADKIYGGWLGRVCGCYLGKPVEGIKSEELNKLLKLTGNNPLHRYIFREDVSEQIAANIKFPIRSKVYSASFGKMPADDDTNYTVMAQQIIAQYGRNFKPSDVANSWTYYQTKNAYCTAERVAYINFVNGYEPPESALYKNPYREWIGAQIRGDYFGYINPCNPESAANMAQRDASISHVKNGIYGEMWVSAMIACAFGGGTIEQIIRGGLSQIPKTSRLYEKIQIVLADYLNGISCEECFKKIHENWDEKNSYDWCHTISNAIIVTASLLYGGGNYEKSVCLAVEQGFDTDCNAATVGSIIGVYGGSSSIPASFSEPICDTLVTTIFGVGTVSIKKVANDTLCHLEN